MSKKYSVLKDVSSGDALDSGLIGTGLYLYDIDGYWYRARGSLAYGLNVELKKSINLTMIGSKTLSDAYANPTDAINAFSLLGGFNGTTWDRLRLCPSPSGTGILQIGKNYKQAHVLVASGAKTTSGNSGAITGFGCFNSAIIEADITAVSGTTPTLDLYLDTTIDDSNWINMVHFTQITAISRRFVKLCDHYTSDVADADSTVDLPVGTVNQGVWGSSLRVRWIVGGTSPSFTFSVKGLFKS